MKKSIKILSMAILGLAAVACASPEKMAEAAENLNINCDPAVLEVVGGVIEADVTVTYPEKYFHPRAILEVTPVIVYEGGEAKMTPFVFQGEKVQDNYQVVPSEGATVTKTVKFDYAPGMEKSYLELRGVVKYKNKSANLPTIKVADGANTTYMLAQKEGRLDFKKDNYQDVIHHTAEGQINYTINSSYVRNKEYKSSSIQEFLYAVEEIKADERMRLVSTDILAYASPDGKEDQNNKLSNDRSKSAEKAFNRITKKNPIDAPVNVQSLGEDWEGFQELVAKSNIQDKDLIIRVLSMYSDPAIREQEIKNMSAVYTTLAENVLPELRRARFVANAEFDNYSHEELLQLLEENSNYLDEEALLRTATLLKDKDQKVACYKKAAERFGSKRAWYNLAVIYLNDNMISVAKSALNNVDKDGDWNNAMGVIALRENDFKTAADFFKKANTEAANENLALLEILEGDYEAAVKQFGNSKSFNAALANVLTGNYAPALALTCKCPTVSYLKAVVAARQGNKADVKANLENASKCEELAARSVKDIEFAQYR